MVATAEAPGQIDLFPGEGPASPRVLLPLPLRLRARVRTVEEAIFRARWLLPGAARGEVEAPFDVLLPADDHPEYASVRARFETDLGGGLGARILGGIPILGRERKAILDRAAVVDVEGDLPADRTFGLHAALEVASLKGILRAYGANVGGREVARLALRVERLIAGGEGTLSSRLVAASAHSGFLVPVRGEEPGEPIPLPAGVVFLLLIAEERSPVGEERTRAGGAEPSDGWGAGPFLAALRRLEEGWEVGLRELGRAMRAPLPPGGPGELLGAIDRLGPERGVFGATGLEGSGALLALVDSRGESAVRELLPGVPGSRLVCRVEKGPA